MNTFVAVCIGVLTLTHLVGLVMLIATLIHVRRSAEAMESFALQAKDEVAKIASTTEKLRDFAYTLRSGWMRAFTMGLSAVLELLPRPKGGAGDHKEAASGSEKNV